MLYYYTILVFISERFIRSFKSRLFKYFTAKNTLKYTSPVLDDMLLALNNRHHRSIGRPPSSVNKKNEKEVFQYQYGDYLAEKKKRAKYDIGDIVRVSKARNMFRKGYLKTFTDEKFRVIDVLNTLPTTYRLVAHATNEVIIGTWYESELVRVREHLL